MCGVQVGGIDLSTASILRVYLGRAARSNRPVILDLSRVEYFDASGLRVVEEYTDDSRRRNLQFVLVPSRIVKRVVSLLGLPSPWPPPSARSLSRPDLCSAIGDG